MKKLESGRSMVEMLGVLAIIGVLSVGGIAGYTLSMRRHRANNVADGAAKLALVAYSQCQNAMLTKNYSDVNDCGSGDGVKLSFTDAGLGNLPSGVSSITVTAIENPGGTGAADDVKVQVSFGDENLCKTFGTIVSATCTNKKVDFTIKQN